MKKLFLTLVVALFATFTFAQDCYTVSNTGGSSQCDFEVGVTTIYYNNGNFVTMQRETATITPQSSHDFCFNPPHLRYNSVVRYIGASCPNFSQSNLPLTTDTYYNGGNCDGSGSQYYVRWVPNPNDPTQFKIGSGIY